MEEGLKRSRLPKFTPEQIKYLKGTSDFFGLNFYSSVKARKIRNEDWYNSLKVPSWDRDLGHELYYDPSWPSTIAPMFKVSVLFQIIYKF